MVLAVIATGLVFSASAANTWWVDDANYGAEVQDGSEEHPFGTILAAVTNEACVAGDTIKVKPGTYDKDYDERTVTISGTDYQMRTRIWINKKVYIVATGTKEETHIVGRWTSAAEGGNDTYHAGPEAVKCIRVTTNGLKSTLTGFTIRDSASINADGDYTYINGGAFGVESYNKEFYVTDCVISNCISRKYGGVSCGGTLNRCRIYGCAASTRGAAFYNSYAINTVVAGCQLLGDGNTTVSYHSYDRLVNCTIYGNQAARVETSNCYNCLFASNLSVETNGTSVSASNVYASPGRDYCNEPTENPLFAPYLGDFHPITGSVAIGAGDPTKFSLITLPKGTEIRDLDGNLIDTTAEHIAAGAFQTAKTRPEMEHKYGAVFFDGLVSINGYPCTFNPLVYADTWPTTIKATPGWDDFRFAVTGERLTGINTVNSRYTRQDGYVAITPPYAKGAVQTNRVVSVSFTRYVDAVNGDNENDGKSPDTAFKTLQRAVDAIGEASTSNQAKGWRIYVAEGDYKEGGALGRGVTNRINVTGQRWMKFIATGDRDKTIIRGAAAKDERDSENYPGCGPDAVRCVSFSYNSSGSGATLTFVGFTFADGHSDCGQSTSDNNIGGAAYGRTGDGRTDCLQFIDCVFTNCYAQEGIATRGRFSRCRFIDCGAGTRGFRYSILDSCIVEKGNFGKGVFGTYAVALNCSVADANAIMPADGGGRFLLNCALGESGLMVSGGKTWGCTVNSCFADAANGDFRFVSGSPALDATRREFPEPGTADWDTFTKHFSDFASCAIDGAPYVVSGGFPVAGAYVGWVPGVSLVLDADNADNYSISGATVGGNLLSPGDTVTISRSPSAVRHYGIVVNGVTNMLDSGAYVYTMPADSGMTDGAIYQIIDQNWYVNPDPESGASDLNDGFTTNTPKLTLAGVLSVATNAGDVVNAYPGTYDSGEMRHTASANVLARGVVAADVTLQAVGSVSETIIKGAASTAPDKDSNGNGTNAVRCVYVRDGACVRGFKLTGGRTDRRYDSSTQADANGGAAYLNGGALVDCELSGNGCAYRGRAVTGVGSTGAAVIRCYMHDQVNGTYEVYNASVVDSHSSTYYGPGPILNSTMTGDVRSSSKIRILNTYLYSASATTDGSTWCTNCVFMAAAGSAAIRDNRTSYDPDTCSFSAATADNLDANKRPKTASSVLVDAGDKALYDRWFPSKWVQFKTNRDMTGGQRIYNGEIDVGCGEYDFRGDFAAMLGQRAVISEMGPNVTTNVASNIVVPEGDAIVLSMSPLRPGREFAYDLVYTPDGGEEVAISGKSTEEFSRTLEGACTVQSFAGRSTLGCILIYR